MGFDQKTVTEVIGQGSTHLAFETPEGVNLETKPPQSSWNLTGSIGNIGTLSTVGTVNRSTATLPMMGSAFRASTVDAVNSPKNFMLHGATSPGRQGWVVPVSASPPVNSGGSVRYAKVLSLSPKQAQESLHLAPRSVSMENVTISRENTLTSIEELPESRSPLDQTKVASNMPQSFMQEIRLMMQELRQDFSALQSRVNALPVGNTDGKSCSVLEAVEAEKKERKREMGELAAFMNMSLAEIRAQVAVFSDHLTTFGDMPAIVQHIEEPEWLEGIVKSLLRPERDARAEIATCLEAERAGRVQDLNNERDARVREMDEVRLSLRALAEKLDGHGGHDAFLAQELVHEREARERGNAEMAMALEEATVRALEHCNSLEQRVASQLLRNHDAMVASDNVLTGANEEALCNEGQQELRASLVDLQANIAQHREHMREVETGLVQGLAEDIVALKEHGASIDALHSDVKDLQASAIDTAELLLEVQQELRNIQQISRTDMEMTQGCHTHKAQLVDVELHKTQLGHLEAAHTSHGSKLSSLEAAHGKHATLVESHSEKLSELATAHEFHLSAVETYTDKLGQLEAAHGQATSMVESHKAQLSDLEAARSSHASIVESHESKLSSLEAAHGHHTTMFETHGNQLSSLKDAHSQHTSMMEAHNSQLGDLESARLSHASIVESHGSKLSCLEAAHGHHATMVESYGTQLRELVTAHEQQLSALETHTDQLRHLEAAHGHATALVDSHVDQLSSLKDRHSIDIESHKQHISELQAAQGHHTSTLESLQHQVNSVQNLEQLVSRLSVDMDVIRQRQQDSKGRPHESHEIAGRFEEHTTLINELRSKINELEVSSVESAELHKSWKASHQELHQAHTTRASALEDSHAQHRGDLETLRCKVESWRSLDEQMGCLFSDMEALKQRLPAGSNPKVVGHFEDHSVMAATLNSDLQVLQVENADYEEAGAVESASSKMEAAATKIQCSARGRMARKQLVEGRDEAGVSKRASIEMEAAATRIQSSARGVMARKLATERREQVGAVERANNERDAAATRIQCSARGRLARRQLAEHREARVADIQLATSELQVPCAEPVIERQETGLSSAISERQVTGSDKQSVSGKPQAQRSWWQSLTSGGSPQTPRSPHATPLEFTIIGAKGLRVADWTHGEGKSDPYCICELKGKSKTSKTQTQVIDDDLDPIWNHKALFNDYVVGDSLVFKIYDADYIDLGSLVLSTEKFHPHGFEGELPLENAGEDSTAVLRLKIEASPESRIELPVEVTMADTIIAISEKQVAVAETVVATSESEVVVADTNIATSEHVVETESVIERQDSLVDSAITERQVTGPEHSAPRSLWNRLTSRVSSQAAASTAFQAAGSEATPLRMTIQSARGLRVADWTSGEGKSDPYCICELKGKSSASKIQTQVVDHDLDPEWNHEGVLNDYTVGDSLEFKIYDVDYIFLGSLVLPSEQFHPHGFEGELPLEDAGEDSAAVLRLKIEPLVDIKDEPAFEAAEDWEAEY